MFRAFFPDLPSAPPPLSALLVFFVFHDLHKEDVDENQSMFSGRIKSYYLQEVWLHAPALPLVTPRLAGRAVATTAFQI